MYNKQAIMTHAWEIHRKNHETCAPWQFERGIHDGSFAFALRAAWRQGRAKVAKARMAALMASNAEAVTIQRQIENAQYLPFGMDRTRRIRRLRHQLVTLAA